MSGDYRPAAGDTVKVEAEVAHVYADGSLDLKPLTSFGMAIPVRRDAKVELVKRKAPVLKPGDVVQGPYGTWLIGSRLVTYTSAANGGTVDSNHTAETLAQNAALSPQSYTIIKHKENV